MAPDILIRTDARALRLRAPAATPNRPQRLRLLRAAWRAFAGGTVDCGPFGAQDAAGFGQTLWETAGYPRALTDRWTAMLGDWLSSPARDGDGPLDSAADGEDSRPATLRAPTLVSPTLVSLPGNTFTCLESVLSACLAGEAVWIRPSSREPVSALRMVAALLHAGWPGHLLGLYPTGWSGLGTLIEVTGRKIVYGGAAVAAAFGDVVGAGLRGPVRAVATVASDIAPDRAADRLLRLVAADSGRFCTNLRTIICLGDAAEVAQQLASRLDGISLSPADPAWPVCAWPDRAQAEAILAGVMKRETEATRRVTRRPTFMTEAGLDFLAPTLFSWQLPPGAAFWATAPPLVRLEVPFPFAAISQGSPAQAAAFARSADIAHHISDQSSDQ